MLVTRVSASGTDDAMSKTVQFAGITMTGLLADNEFGTLIGSHPALRSLPLQSRIMAKQALTAQLGKIMPFYMTGTVVAAVSAALDRHGTADRRLPALAAGATLLALGITLRGNVPLNARTAGYPSDGTEAGWVDIRSRWERLHTARVLLNFVAFGALTTSALRQR